MEFVRKDRYNMEDLLAIMRILRSEGGCPWDREQTHATIRKNLIEETYEAVEAIDQEDAAMLREELGDVLLQVVFHSQMEEERSVFSFSDVANDICEKLIVRHPHIFGDVRVTGVDEVLDNWNAIKQQTKGQSTAAETLAAVPKQLPALMRAEKVQGRAHKANAGFCGADAEGAFRDLADEVEELREALCSKDSEEAAGELGDVLFAAVGLARQLDRDPEELLTRSVDRFISRLTRTEELAGARGVPMKDVDGAQLAALWEESKGAAPQ